MQYFYYPLRQTGPVTVIRGYLTKSRVISLGLKFKKAKGNITLGTERTSFTSSISYQQTPLKSTFICVALLFELK